MAKRVELLRAQISGDSVNNKDNPAFILTDIQPGDQIQVIRKRTGQPDLILLNKVTGLEMKRAIPAALSALHDALAVIVSVRILYRTTDTAGWTLDQKGTVFDNEEAKILQNVDENPWA